MQQIVDFSNALDEALGQNSFVKLKLDSYRGMEPLKSIEARRIVVKRQDRLSFTYHYKTRDIVKNHDFAESVELVRTLLEDGFTGATLYTTAFDLRLQNGKISKQKASQTEAPSVSHDRGKQRLIGPEKAYLMALGITDAKGNVYKNAQDKFRQINHYIELVSPRLQGLPEGKLTIVDMGSGKGYLTFALYDYVTQVLKRRVEMIGVEMRADMVALCNDIARNSEFAGLRFVESSIADYDCSGADVVIALHACDTATDDALAKAIRAQAALIVVAPCCHKQIRREMEKSKAQNALDFLTRHGTYLERQAEMVTDGMRAQLLEYEGYQTKLFEFVSDAHTPKNVMLVAERGGKAHDAKKLAEIHAAKAYFGIGQHYLERLLGIAA